MITSPSSTTSKPNRTPKAAVGIVMLVEVRSLHSLSTVVSVCISRVALVSLQSFRNASTRYSHVMSQSTGCENEVVYG